MANEALWQYPVAKLSIALIAGVLLVGGSFLVAGYTQHIDQLFELSPAVSNGVTVPQLDVISSEKIYFFHTTIYTIWATILLSLPAFCTVWFIRSIPVAGSYWLAFWTVGLIAMLVHQYLAMGLLFEWNWQHILKDTVRVTIPIPDLVLTVWWTIDVVLGWCLLHSRGIVLHGQRIFLHIALLIIFLIGFIREGEIVLSKVIGVATACVVVIALVVGLVNNRRNSVYSS